MVRVRVSRGKARELKKTSAAFPLGGSDDRESVGKSLNESVTDTLIDTLTEKLGWHEEFPSDFHEEENEARGDVESE
jgi:hypothetical protein